MLMYYLEDARTPRCGQTPRRFGVRQGGRKGPPTEVGCRVFGAAATPCAYPPSLPQHAYFLVEKSLQWEADAFGWAEPLPQAKLGSP